MWLLYIIYCFWNNTFYRMVRVWILHLPLEIVFIWLIYTWAFFSQQKFSIEDSTFESRENCDIFITPILHPSRVLVRKDKNSVFCLNWEMKCNWGSEWPYDPLGGFSGGAGSQPLGTFAMFSLELGWYSLLEIIKLKLSMKKLLL